MWVVAVWIDDIRRLMMTKDYSDWDNNDERPDIHPERGF